MANMRGQWISVPAYCYPRYDYLSERADTLMKIFNQIKGLTRFPCHPSRARVKRDNISRIGKPLKSKLNICVFYKEEDSDFYESKQFLVKVADEEYTTEHVAISSGHFLKPPWPGDIDLPRIYIIVLSGELSEVSKEVEYFTILKKFPQQHTYFVSKDKKMCCKMEDISNRDQWTGNVSHLVQSGLEKTVMDLVKQMEKILTEFRPDIHYKTYCQGLLTDFFPYNSCGFGGLEETYKNDKIKRIESRQMEILKRKHRLQFLTKALLRQSPLTCNDIKEPPKLPKKLQEDLLKKPFVTGCGTIFGKLVIHVKSATSEEQNKDIEDCIKPYGNFFPYKVEVFVPVCRKTAGQGNCIRAEKLTSSHDEKYNNGSLGCFVDVKIKESNQEEVHFITCHHCLNDCSDKVSVWGQNMEYEDLGVKKHSHKAADIALVQVIKPHLISKVLKHYDGEREFDKWQFYQDGEYLGRQVYKVGATSGTTKGVIVSDNYLLNPEILADELPPNLFLIAPYSALNVPEQRADADDRQPLSFSYEGDSGSVVCDTNPDSGDGLELGLLHGFVFDENTPEHSIYSYTSNMKSALNMHKEKHRGADAADVQHPYFSYEGDSGSVVCDINPDSGDGLVLGLLHGCVFDENNPEHYIYSYASNMKSALNMLKEKHPDIESIEPSLDQDQYPDLPGQIS